MSSRKFLLPCLLFLTLALSSLMLFQSWHDRAEEAEIAFTGQIGRMHEQDAQMSLALGELMLSGAPAAAARYERSLAQYRGSFDQAMSELPAGELKIALARAATVQARGVRVERQALALCGQGQCDQGRRLLAAPDYQRGRLAAMLDREAVLSAFEKAQRSQNLHVQQGLLLLELALTAAGLLTIALWRRGQQNRTRLLLSQARLETLQVTVRTVMDVVNNNLNRLRLLQLRLRKSANADPTELHEIGLLIRETSEQLKAIGEMQSYRTHGQGPAELLEWKPAQPVETPARVA